MPFSAIGIDATQFDDIFPFFGEVKRIEDAYLRQVVEIRDTLVRAISLEQTPPDNVSIFWGTRGDVYSAHPTDALLFLNDLLTELDQSVGKYDLDGNGQIDNDDIDMFDQMVDLQDILSYYMDSSVDFSRLDFDGDKIVNELDKCKLIMKLGSIVEQ